VNADTARQTAASILLGLMLASALVISGHVDLPSGIAHPAGGFSDSYQVVTVPSGLSKLFATAEREDKLSQVPIADAGPTAGPETQEPGRALDSGGHHGHREIDVPHVTLSTRPSTLRTSETAKAAQTPTRAAATSIPRDRNPSGGPAEGRQPRKPGRVDVAVTHRAGVRRDGAVAQRGERAVARGDSAAPRRVERTRRPSAAVAATSHPTGKPGVARKPVASNNHKSSAGQGRRNGDIGRSRAAKASR
jgi:hypothetical protein